MNRYVFSLLLALGASACASAPPAAPPKPAGPTFEQKMASILRLEDRRDAAGTGAGRRAARARRRPAAASPPWPLVPPPPPPPTDLVRLLADDEARIRRRAALAIGRVGLKEAFSRWSGCSPANPIPKCGRWRRSRSGLLGDKSARDPLRHRARPIAHRSCRAAPPKRWDSSATRRPPTRSPAHDREDRPVGSARAAAGRRRRCAPRYARRSGAARRLCARPPEGLSAARIRSARSATGSRASAGGRSRSRCSGSKTSGRSRRC